MKPYIILRLTSDPRPVVIATSYINPLSQMPFIRRELQKLNYTGEILFDQLLSNGYASNRFLKSNYKGDRLVSRNIKVTSAPDSAILEELDAFYRANPQFVKASSLTEPEKQALLA